MGSAEWKKRGDRRGFDRIFGRRALLRPSRPEPWEGWHGDCCPQTMEGLGTSGFLHCAGDWFAALWVFGTPPDALGCSIFVTSECDEIAADARPAHQRPCGSRWGGSYLGTPPGALGCPIFVTSECDENVTFFRLRGCGRSGILPAHQRGEAFVLPAAQVVGGKGSSPGTIPDRGFEMERTE